MPRRRAVPVCPSFMKGDFPCGALDKRGGRGGRVLVRGSVRWMALHAESGEPPIRGGVRAGAPHCCHCGSARRSHPGVVGTQPKSASSVCRLGLRSDTASTPAPAPLACPPGFGRSGSSLGAFRVRGVVGCAGAGRIGAARDSSCRCYRRSRNSRIRHIEGYVLSLRSRSRWAGCLRAVSPRWQRRHRRRRGWRRLMRPTRQSLWQT